MVTRQQVESLRGAVIDLAQLAQAGAGAQSFIDTLASKRQEAKALALEIETSLADHLGELQRVKDELRQKQSELAQTERQLLQLRQHIEEDKAKLRAQLDAMTDHMQKGRAA
jgi:predicted  nucleic acid-binding Zn-ribbon protein